MKKPTPSKSPPIDLGALQKRHDNAQRASKAAATRLFSAEVGYDQARERYVRARDDLNAASRAVLSV